MTFRCSAGLYAPEERFRISSGSGTRAQQCTRFLITPSHGVHGSFFLGSTFRNDTSPGKTRILESLTCAGGAGWQSSACGAYLPFRSFVRHFGLRGTPKQGRDEFEFAQTCVFFSFHYISSCFLFVFRLTLDSTWRHYRRLENQIRI